VRFNDHLKRFNCVQQFHHNYYIMLPVSLLFMVSFLQYYMLFVLILEHLIVVFANTPQHIFIKYYHNFQSIFRCILNTLKVLLHLEIVLCCVLNSWVKVFCALNHTFNISTHHSKHTTICWKIFFFRWALIIIITGILYWNGFSHI
jgi:hypothetical protein